MISFNYSNAFDNIFNFNTILLSIALFIFGIFIIKVLVYLFNKYDYLLKGKKRITDRNYISERDLDEHEVNIHSNKMNKSRRKTDLKKIVKPTTGAKIAMD
jgi:hypothetical protein